MPSIPKESWHLPNFIRLSKVKAKFLDGLRVQMLLQAFQKYEMSNRMLIEQTFQQPLPNQNYITTTILPPLRGDPTLGAHPIRHAPSPSPYGPPLPPNHLPRMHAPSIAPTPPPPASIYNIGNEPEDAFSNEINEELIHALKNEIDLLRVENAYMRTKGRNVYTDPAKDDLYDYGEEMLPYAQPTPHNMYPTHTSPSPLPPPTYQHQMHEMKMIDNSLSRGRGGYYPNV